MEGKERREEREQLFRGEVLPPPIAKVTETADEESGGIVGYDETHDRLLHQYFAFYGFGSSLVEIYDRWISKELQQFIREERIPLNTESGDLFVAFDNIVIAKPQFPNGDPLLPWQAIVNGFTYANSVSMTAFLVQKLPDGSFKREGDSVEMKNIFSIPCMPLSTYCHYSDLRLLDPVKRADTLREMGEDPYTPGGWFVIEGAVKILMIQEMLRQNYLMLISLGKDAIPVVRMLVATRRTTVLIQLNVGKASNYKFQFSSLGKVLRKSRSEKKEESAEKSGKGEEGKKAAKGDSEEGKTTGGKTEKNRYHSVNAYILIKYLLQKANITPDEVHIDDDLRRYIYTILTNNRIEEMDETVFQITALILMVSNRDKAKRILFKLIPTIAKYFGKLSNDPLTHMKEKMRRAVNAANQARSARKPKRGKKGEKTKAEEYSYPNVPSSAESAYGATPGELLSAYFETTKKEREETTGDAELTERVDRMIEDEFFPQLNKLTDSEKFRCKAMMAIIMTSMMSEYQAGIRKINDKNGWDVKQLESAGVLMKRLFQAAWRHFVMQHILKKSDKVKTLGNVVADMTTQVGSNITNTFISAFKSGKWGVRKVHMRENVAQNAGRTERAEFFSLITKVDVDAPRKGAQEIIRENQLGQRGFISFNETPEGDSCGLLKNLTALAQISADGSDLYEENILTALMQHNLLRAFPSKEHGDDTKFMINGKFIGFCPGVKTCNYLIEEHRRKNPNYALVGLSIFIDEHKYLKVYTDGSRPIRPLLVVDDDGVARIVKKPHLLNANFEELLREGCVEYIDPAEQDNYRTLIANSLDVLQGQQEEKAQLESSREDIMLQMEEFKGKTILRIKGQFISLEMLKRRLSQVNAALETLQKRRYTHVELNVSVSIFSLNETLISKPDTTNSARITFELAMRRGITAYPHPWHEKMLEGKYKAIVGSSRPFFQTQMTEIMGYNEYPTGFNLSVLVAPQDAYGMEDSFILNKRVVDAGFLRYYKYMTFKATFRNQGSVTESLEKPILNSLREQELYKYIVDKDQVFPDGRKVYAGTPMIGAWVKEGMAIIGKVKRTKEGDREKVDNESVELTLTNEGIVHSVYVYRDDNYTLVIVKIRTLRLPSIGDKAQIGTQSQKATYGLIMNPEDMPEGPGGQTPSIIFNPHALPSRMTVGVVEEMIIGEAGGLINKVYDASPFRDRRPMQEEVREVLLTRGYTPTGYMRFKSGKTGEMIQGLMYKGRARVEKLRHDVTDKIQIRVVGHVKEETRQAPRGKKGAVRFGEMEFQALISHGAAFAVNERGCTLSDAYEVVLCRNCSTPSLADFSLREYRCPFCGVTAKIVGGKSAPDDPNNPISAFGKATIPYSLYLFIRLTGVLGFYIGFTSSKNGEPSSLMRTNLPSGEEAEEPETGEEAEEPDEEPDLFLLGDDDEGEGY